MTHSGGQRPHTGDIDLAVLGMSDQCQDMTTDPRLEPKWLLPFLH